MVTCCQFQEAVVGIDDEDESTFTISADHRTYHFQGIGALLCLSICLFVSVCVCLWLCVCVCFHVHVYTYVHTCICCVAYSTKS